MQQSSQRKHVGTDAPTPSDIISTAKWISTFVLIQPRVTRKEASSVHARHYVYRFPRPSPGRLRIISTRGNLGGKPRRTETGTGVCTASASDAFVWQMNTSLGGGAEKNSGSCAGQTGRQAEGLRWPQITRRPALEKPGDFRRYLGSRHRDYRPIVKSKL